MATRSNGVASPPFPADLPPGTGEDRWVPSACGLCYGFCSIVAHRRHGTVVKIEGNPESPIGAGRLCGKGVSGIMTLYDPNRLDRPLRRTNPEKGIGVDPGWREIGWDEALEEIAARLGKIREEDPRRLFIQKTTTSRAPFSAFGAAFGTKNFWVAGGGLHCGNGAHLVGGLFHASWSIVPDFRYTNYAIYFGASKGHAAGHVACANVQQAADARVRGMKLVVVDPMCNFASAKATEWVPIRVGTDAALALAMVNCLLNDLGIWDGEYLEARTNAPYLIAPDGTYARDGASGKPLVWAQGRGVPYDDPGAAHPRLEGTYEVGGVVCRPAFEVLRSHVRRFTPEWASGLTTVPADTIRRLAREFGTEARVGATIVVEGRRLPYRPVAAVFFRGAQGHRNSLYTCYAIELLNQVVGAADVVGGCLGFNAVCDGHPETGRPAYRPTAGPDGLMVPGTWVVSHLPYPLPEPAHPDSMGLSELFPLGMFGPFMASADQEELWQRFGLPYRPGMLLNYGANSLMSVGNSETVAGTLRRIPFIVSFDVFLTEFSAFADIVLPDAGYLESLDSRPNVPFIFNLPAGLGEWCWPIRQPVVAPAPDRRSAADVLIDLADRIGIREDLNAAFNAQLRLGPPHRLDLRKPYTWEEVCDRDLRSHFGDERGLEWFREHGLVRWPKKVEEVYWRAFLPLRVPVYLEFMKAIGEKAGRIARAHGLDWDPSYYEPLPDWKPCPAHESARADFDLYAFYYRDTIHTNSFTHENPWLDEAARADPFSYRIAVNTRTARAKGLAEGDLVWVESERGRRVRGRLHLTEAIHPEGLAIAGCAGHWGPGLPVARGKGVFFNDLLEIDWAHTSPVDLNLDLCVKVRLAR